MKKRIFSLLLSCAVVLSLCPLEAQAVDGAYTPENYEMYTSGDEDVLTLEEIAGMTPEELEEMELLSVNLNARSLQVNASYEVPSYNIQQVNYYYCGPASTLQAIYTSGMQDSVAGNTYAEKQATLASNSYLCTDRDGATWIDYVPNALNTFIPRFREWTRSSVGVESKDDYKSVDSAEYFIRSNHAYGYAVIYLLRTHLLSYYPDGETHADNGNHYVTGTAVYYDTLSTTDYENMRLRINDSNNKSAYFGTFYEEFNNVMDAMIAYTTSRGPANFVY